MHTSLIYVTALGAGILYRSSQIAGFLVIDSRVKADLGIPLQLSSSPEIATAQHPANLAI